MKFSIALLLSTAIVAASAFAPAQTRFAFGRVDQHSSRQDSPLFAGGFGGGGGKPKKKASKTSKDAKLKPKQQWDRYLDMKRENKIPVAVRVKEDDSEWVPVGNVKTKDNAYTAVAVAKQRALIAEHASRLQPLQGFTKKTLEWAYSQGEGEWTVVDKSILEGDSTDGVDKMIGFEGTPDPASGYYCVYDLGKITKSKQI